MTILVTGAAGFIGFHLADRLLRDGHAVVGFDSYTPFYDVSLKHARVKALQVHDRYTDVTGDLADAEALTRVFNDHAPDVIVHLAAQAGVRDAVKNAPAYVASNLVGFANVLECCRVSPPKHLVFASTSSVYGANTKMPFAETDHTDHPVSFYAATKKANEVMAHSYAALYGVPMTGLRFFTVYGPWGRPDMAPYKFVKAVLNGQPIDVFGHGQLSRDFTYIDDIVEGIVRVMDHVPRADADWSGDTPDPSSSGVAPFRLFNIGRGQPVGLNDFIAEVERATGKPATRNLMDIQPGEVEKTWCDISALEQAVGYRPTTDLHDGIDRFVAWFKAYHKI